MTLRPSPHVHRQRRGARALAVPSVAVRFALAFGLLLVLAALVAMMGQAHAAERGVTFGPQSPGTSGGYGGYGGYGGGTWDGGGNSGANNGGNWNGGNNGAGLLIAPNINVPTMPDQTPMPQGAPMIPANQIQAIVAGAGYAQVKKPTFSQGYYYMEATSAAGPVLLAVDAYSGQVVSSRPSATTPRPPVVESGSLIGSGSLVGTPPPSRPRGPLAPDPNNPDGE